MDQPLEKGREGMRPFTVYRRGDQSGVSGTGVVVEGVLFASGQCVVHWLTPAPQGSIALWPSFEDFYSVHIAPHPPNRTVVEFADGCLLEQGQWVVGQALPEPLVI